MISATALIEQLKPDTPDADVAKLVARYMLESDRVPYWFSIDHDIGPPKYAACPVDFDWSAKKRVGIKTNNRARAEKWIAAAVLAGYTVSRETERQKDLTCSIAIARRRAFYAQQP